MGFTRETATFDGRRIPVHAGNTLVIGSGAAALNAALQLHARGITSLALATEAWGAGTSRNAGSDKQTYYKLATAGGREDSAPRMAADLMAGGGMHGDIALCEAQHSLEAFYHLTQLGVSFPQDRFGAYPGYRTDHDPVGRGTSAGPLTSQEMCAQLGAAVRARGIEILDPCFIVALLADSEGVCGAFALGADGPILFNAVNIVIATGGPGGLYRTSVYPPSQSGALGMALAIGAVAQNLTDWQYGIASLEPRWNLSGSFQQVVPRYLSTTADGGDAREFLGEIFPDAAALTRATFRKGYEWPFDSTKLGAGHSALIDLAVDRELRHLRRRVYLNFTRNPSAPETGEELAYEELHAEARDYLEKANAAGPTPLARLRALNPAAYEFYRAHGVDLARESLEITIAAQHCNGGLRANLWWESNVAHLFPVGEACGTHGPRRPGGSALNAGQVGALRAARYIAQRYRDDPPALETFRARIAGTLAEQLVILQRLEAPHRQPLTPEAVIEEIQARMSGCAAHVRDPRAIERAADEAWKLQARVREDLRVTGAGDLPQAYRARDLTLTHAVVLAAMQAHCAANGGSRGGAIVLDPKGEAPPGSLGADYTYAAPATEIEESIQEIALRGPQTTAVTWVPPRPIPRGDDCFERVWDDHRADRIVR